MNQVWSIQRWIELFISTWGNKWSFNNTQQSRCQAHSKIHQPSCQQRKNNQNSEITWRTWQKRIESSLVQLGRHGGERKGYTFFQDCVLPPWSLSFCIPSQPMDTMQNASNYHYIIRNTSVCWSHRFLSIRTDPLTQKVWGQPGSWLINIHQVSHVVLPRDKRSARERSQTEVCKWIIKTVAQILKVELEEHQHVIIKKAA